MDMIKQKWVSNHHFNEPKCEYTWPSTKVSGNTVHKPTEYTERDTVNPQTSSHSFIWQTFLKTHHGFGTLLGA